MTFDNFSSYPPQINTAPANKRTVQAQNTMPAPRAQRKESFVKRNKELLLAGATAAGIITWAIINKRNQNSALLPKTPFNSNKLYKKLTNNNNVEVYSNATNSSDIAIELGKILKKDKNSHIALINLSEFRQKNIPMAIDADFVIAKFPKNNMQKFEIIKGIKTPSPNQLQIAKHTHNPSSTWVIENNQSTFNLLTHYAI